MFDKYIQLSKEKYFWY